MGFTEWMMVSGVRRRMYYYQADSADIMSNPEHLERLKEGVAAWHEWRNSNPSIEPDLGKADLSHANLSAANLSGANLRDANLTMTDLRQTDLTKADLSHANLNGANVSRANLSGADLSHANLSRANLSGANLGKADLSHAHLGEADLSESNLFEAKLGKAYLAEANLSKANLSKADLSEAYLFEAKLGKAYLAEANLGKANLGKADLSEAYLFEAKLGKAYLVEANLSKANLSKADLSEAYLFDANLSKANLSKANLVAAYLFGPNLREANLREADLVAASLLRTNLEDADLTGCRVYGISVWDAKLEGATQSNLIITPGDEPAVSVDNLEVAQFIYLLLNNARIRHVIDTITSKIVLILGRFTPERKAVLDAIRDEIRKRDYVPVLFDFEKPTSKDLTGTISTLANMARFIVADLTDPASVPHELRGIVPDIVVPIQTIILEGHHEYAMFVDLKERYHWVLEPYQYSSLDSLLGHLSKRVIAPAEAKAIELKRKSSWHIVGEQEANMCHATHRG